nr:hypothetical protein [Tanacetum cinerariifolium]
MLMLFPLLANALPGGDLFKKPEFLEVGQAFMFSSERLESGETRLYWQIADGYYLYQKRLKFEGLSASQQPALPAGEDHNDEYFGAGPGTGEYASGAFAGLEPVDLLRIGTAARVHPVLVADAADPGRRRRRERRRAAQGIRPGGRLRAEHGDDLRGPRRDRGAAGRQPAIDPSTAVAAGQFCGAVRHSFAADVRLLRAATAWFPARSPGDRRSPPSGRQSARRGCVGRVVGADGRSVHDGASGG